MRLQNRRAGLGVAEGYEQESNSALSFFGFASTQRRGAGLRLMTVAGAALLLVSGQRVVLGQGMYPPQGWSQAGPYGAGYPPQYAQQAYAQPGYAQPGYGQPRYGPPQSYGSQAYAHPQPYGQPYAQQGYRQTQPYGQPSYPQGSYGQQAYSAGGQGYGQQGYAASQPGYGQGASSGQSLSAEQLEQMVAPIALYPDTLIAQMLAASTYPAEVVDADRWVQAQGNASPYEIAGGADMRNWDPSVKGLTAFPQVLAEMDRNARWTTDLGNAYYNQPQDVLEAVQVMRQRAQAAGNLRSTPQEQVSYNQGAIELTPPNPQTVYVPSYNPWSVYGEPVQPYEGFSLLGDLGSLVSSALGSSPLQYGLGIAMQAFNHTPFGWLSWGLSWLTDSILFNHSDYASNSTSVADWGIRGGGMRAYAGDSGRNGYGRSGYGSGQGFGRSPDRYAPVERFGRGEAESYRRQPMEAYNRAPSAMGRQQEFNRPENRLAYGPSFYNGGQRGYFNGGGRGYSNGGGQGYSNDGGRGYSNGGGRDYSAAMRGSRGPNESFQRGDFGARSSQSFKQPKSGGFHLFGGGGNREPSFKEPKMSSGRNSGGHSFFGGGGHSSGGHSGGGHNSGGEKHHDRG